MLPLRENIKAMAGYVPGFQPDGEGWTKLNSNETPTRPPLRWLKRSWLNWPMGVKTCVNIRCRE